MLKSEMVYKNDRMILIGCLFLISVAVSDSSMKTLWTWQGRSYLNNILREEKTYVYLSFFFFFLQKQLAITHRWRWNHCW